MNVCVSVSLCVHVQETEDQISYVFNFLTLWNVSLILVAHRMETYFIVVVKQKNKNPKQKKPPEPWIVMIRNN